VGLKAADLVLQLPPSAPEGVIHGEKHARVPFILAWRTVDIDFATVRQGQMNPHLEEAACVMMMSGRSQPHVARGYAAEKLLETCHLFGDRAVESLCRLQSMVVYLQLRLHLNLAQLGFA
jgi:hypothetical protein